MEQPVVSKIRVYNPNRKGTAKANRGYCTYIATRPGVVIAEVDYTPSQEDSYLKMADNSDYVSYIAKRPRSHGLFGNIDTSDLSQVNSLMEDHSKDKKIIYRGIVSLTENDARELGYFSLDKWKILLESTMSDVGNTFNIPINRLQWVAAYHFEKGHPHCHYMFWDTKDKVVSSFIHVSKQQKCREIFSNEVFREERQLEIINRTAKRDLIIEYGKDIMGESKKYLSDLFLEEKVNAKIPGRIDSSYIDSLSMRLPSLINALPDSGRIAYAYMPPDVKDMVDDITDFILTNKDIQKEYETYINTTESISNTYSASKVKKDSSVEEARRDLYKRIGNIILKTARDIRSDGLGCLFSEYGQQSIASVDTIFNEEHLIESAIERTSWEAPDIPKDFDYPEGEMLSNEDNLPEPKFYDSFEIPENEYARQEDIKNNEEYADATASEEVFSGEEQNSFNSKKKNFSKRSKNIELPYTTWTKTYKEARNVLYPKQKKEKNPELAFKLMGKEMIRKNCLATYDMGIIHERGIGTDINKTASDFYYNKAFHMFIEMSQCDDKYLSDYFSYRLGKMYNYGIGVEQNIEKAIEYLTPSAKNGNAYSQYTLGCIYLNAEGIEHDYPLAFDYFLSSANSGNSYSAYEAAKMLKKGVGVEKNTEKSSEYYKIAFEGFKKIVEEDPTDYMQYRLGKMYYNGEGTTKDIEKAKELFKAAAESKNINAMCQLAIIYLEENRGNIDIESEDYKDAITNLKEASNVGNTAATIELSKLYLMQEGYMNAAVAMNYLNSIHSPDDPYSNYQLGRHYYSIAQQVYNCDFSDDNKFYINNLLNKSYAHFMASDFENSYTNFMLGKIHLFKGTELYDAKIGAEYLEKALSQGNDAAAFALGKLHYQDAADAARAIRDSNTEPAPEDLAKLSASCKDAIRYFSMDPENSFSQLYLGKTYLIENSDTFDRDKAVQFLEKSLENKNLAAAFTLGKLHYQDAADAARAVRESGTEVTPEDLAKISASCKDAIRYFSMDPENSFSQLYLGKTYLIENSDTFDRDKAVQFLEKSLENKNLAAAFTLGKLHYQDAADAARAVRESGTEVTPEDLAKISASCKDAIRYFSMDPENAFSQLYLGKTYLIENSDTFDRDKAVQLLEKSLENKNLAAAFTLGKLHYQDAADAARAIRDSNIEPAPEDLAKLSASCKDAIRYFSMDPENSFSQLYLGKTYLIENSDTFDRDKAVQLLEKSLENKNLAAAFTLGKLHYQDAADAARAIRDSGTVTPEDLAKISTSCKDAIRYFSMDPENAFSQLYLGKTYLIENSDTFNRNKAVQLLEKSLESKNPIAAKTAAFTLGKLYYQEALDVVFSSKKYSPEQLNAINEKCSSALKYLAKADIQSDYVKLKIAQTLLIEQSNTLDTMKAVSILQDMSEKGNFNAQYHLGKLYLFGNKEMKANTKLGLEWLEKAKENGNKYAAHLLQEREKYHQINAAIGGFKMVVSIFNNMNETNNYQHELLQRAIKHSQSKATLREELRKQGIELDKKTNQL